ncbi:MAG: shikimate kinase [Tepidisphaeraceae bacterium]
MTILLLGYRGSGKTSVGKLVAAKLGVEFIDTDQVLQLRAGKTIREIFATQGELAFRDLESSVLEDALRWTGDRVIATGGGIILRDSNRALLERSGAYRFYLRCDADVLHARIHADVGTAENRPALTSLGGGLDEIRSLLAAREPLYEQAKTHQIDVTNLSVEVVAKMIVAEVGTDSFRCFPGAS